MNDEEMKKFVQTYRIASVKVFAKLIDENTFIKGLIDIEKTIAYIKSNNDS